MNNGPKKPPTGREPGRVKAADIFRDVAKLLERWFDGGRLLLETWRHCDPEYQQSGRSSHKDVPPPFLAALAARCSDYRRAAWIDYFLTSSHPWAEHREENNEQVFFIVSPRRYEESPWRRLEPFTPRDALDLLQRFVRNPGHAPGFPAAELVRFQLVVNAVCFAILHTVPDAGTHTVEETAFAVEFLGPRTDCSRQPLPDSLRDCLREFLCMEDHCWGRFSLVVRGRLRSALAQQYDNAYQGAVENAVQELQRCVEDQRPGRLDLQTASRSLGVLGDFGQKLKAMILDADKDRLPWIDSLLWNLDTLGLIAGLIVGDRDRRPFAKMKRAAPAPGRGLKPGTPPRRPPEPMDSLVEPPPVEDMPPRFASDFPDPIGENPATVALIPIPRGPQADLGDLTEPAAREEETPPDSASPGPDESLSQVPEPTDDPDVAAVEEELNPPPAAEPPAPPLPEQAPAVPVAEEKATPAKAENPAPAGEEATPPVELPSPLSEAEELTRLAALAPAIKEFRDIHDTATQLLGLAGGGRWDAADRALRDLLAQWKQFDRGLRNPPIVEDESKLKAWLEEQADALSRRLVIPIVDLDLLLPPEKSLLPRPRERGASSDEVVRAVRALRDQLFAFMQRHGGFSSPEITLGEPASRYKNIETEKVDCPGRRSMEIVEIVHPCYVRTRGNREWVVQRAKVKVAR